MCLLAVVLSQGCLGGPMGHLVMSGDTLEGHRWRVGAASVQRVEARDTSEQPKRHSLVPATKNNSASNAGRAETEKTMLWTLHVPSRPKWSLGHTYPPTHQPFQEAEAVGQTPPFHKIPNI